MRSRLFFELGEYLYCYSKTNVCSNKILKCIYTNANYADFEATTVRLNIHNEGAYDVITLSQSQESLDQGGFKKITKEENPEYYL